MAVPPMTEMFQPITSPAPDWSAAQNWSAGLVPDQAVAAIIAGGVAMIDPMLALSAQITLQGGAACNVTLSGNQSGFSIGADAALLISDQTGPVAASLFAAGGILNQGRIDLAGAAASLRIVVQAGPAIAGFYGFTIPSFGNDGSITITDHAALTIAGTALQNTGSINISAADMALIGGALAGTATRAGHITIDQGGTLSLADQVAGQTISFGPGGGTLTLADLPDFAATNIITGLGKQDVILLEGEQNLSLTTNGADITLLNASSRIVGQFNLAAPPDPATHFVLTQEQNGTILTLAPNPPCFARGTHILTQSGYVPVESLNPHDPVVTNDGAIKPIRWIGQRHFDIGSDPHSHDIRPVRILPGAFAPGLPRRLLRLSPDHALFLEGRLIPVKYLLNGATILREQACQAVSYYHVELDRHDIILAEALPVETYLDTGNRAAFETAHRPVFGRTKNWDQHAAAPLCCAGPILQNARKRLHERAIALGFSIRTLTDIALWMDGVKLPPHHRATPTRPCFSLPADHRGVAIIRSPHFSPAELDPASNDRRALGIAIRAVKLGRSRLLLDDIAGAGFHPRAADDNARWTDGEAQIALPAGRARRLQFSIAALPKAWHGPLEQNSSKSNRTILFR